MGELLIPIDPTYIEAARTKPEGLPLVLRKARRMYQQTVPEDVRNDIWEKRHALARRIKRRVQKAEICGAKAKFEVHHEAASYNTVSLGDEPDFLRRFLEVIEDGDVVWDIGTAHGLYAIFAAKKVGKCEIIAFEPEAMIAEELRRNIQLNELENRIKVQQLALTNEDGWVDLFSNGASGMAPSLAKTYNFSGSYQVEGRTADSLVEEGMKPPSIVKCDVEGCEGNVFTGMMGLLTRSFQGVNKPKHLFVEAHPRMIGKFEGDHSMMIDKVVKCGYKMVSASVRGAKAEMTIHCHLARKDLADQFN
jgi:FkbM family methyltransferase